MAQMGHFGAMLLFLFGLYFGSASVGSMWEPISYFLHILGQSLVAMKTASSASFFGVLVWSIAVPAINWFYGFVGRLRKLRSWTAAYRDKPVGSTVWLTAAWFLLIFSGFVVRQIYVDHTDLANSNSQLAQDNAELRKNLEAHRHSIVTTDPVFPNLIYMLQAFRQFHNELNGEPCAIKFTATPERYDMASVFSQLSIQASNCFTFGPDTNTWMNPDLRKEATEGMVPQAIVFHAARDDKAANSLFLRLSNQISMQRSFDLPQNPGYMLPSGLHSLHTMWFQFGSGVEWNSERYKR